MMTSSKITGAKIFLFIIRTSFLVFLVSTYIDVKRRKKVPPEYGDFFNFLGSADLVSTS
jgi:hypothetical protein